MKLKVSFIILMLCLIAQISLMAQVAINSDGSNPDTTAMLDVNSTGKGLLIPRMTEAQIISIQGPANGLLVFNLTDSKFYVYRSENASWNEIELGARTIAPSSWSCGMSFTDVRNGKTYSSVAIGSQCWMTDNLNIGTMIEGVYDQTDNATIEKYCYSNEEDSCDIHGGLYQWDEMMQYENFAGAQGLCPEGWRLPSEAEWDTLSTELGGDAVSGVKIKSTSGWYAGGNGNNLSGFDAFPIGFRDTDGTFVDYSEFAVFWTSTQNSSTTALTRYLSHDSDALQNNSSWRTYGLSVRCIKDD